MIETGHQPTPPTAGRSSGQMTPAGGSFSPLRVEGGGRFTGQVATFESTTEMVSDRGRTVIQERVTTVSASR